MSASAFSSEVKFCLAARSITRSSFWSLLRRSAKTFGFRHMSIKPFDSQLTSVNSVITYP